MEESGNKQMSIRFSLSPVDITKPFVKYTNYTIIVYILLIKPEIYVKDCFMSPGPTTHTYTISD